MTPNEPYAVDVNMICDCGCKTFHTFPGDEPYFYCDDCGAEYIA